MTYFTKRIYTYFGDSEFIFNRSVKADATKYFVSVRNGEGKGVLFTMEGNGNAWRIINAPQVPEWVLQSENVLAEAIQRHNAN